MSTNTHVSHSQPTAAPVHGDSQPLVGAGTLLRHEFLRTRSMLGIAFGVALGTGLLGILAAQLPGLAVVATLGRLLSFGAGFLIVPAVLLLLVLDYWRSGYSGLGYLTHSIPARGATQYLVRLGYGFAVLTVGAVVAAGILLATYLLDPGARASGAWENGVLPVLTYLHETGLLWWGIAGLLLMLLCHLIQYYFAASVGSEERLGRFGVGGPILVYVILYVVSQVVFFVTILTVPVGMTVGVEQGGAGSSSGAMAGLEFIGVNWFDAMLRNDSPTAMPLGVLVGIGLITIVCFVRTVISWNRKVALQ